MALFTMKKEPPLAGIKNKTPCIVQFFCRQTKTIYKNRKFVIYCFYGYENINTKSKN